MTERLTEDQIERRAESRMNALDRRLIHEKSLTQAEYDQAVRELAAWTEEQLSRRAR